MKSNLNKDYTLDSLFRQPMTVDKSMELCIQISRNDNA
jgi:hypothetical protein